MAEWSIAPVLKTGDPQGSVGSNPTPSAMLIMNDLRVKRLALPSKFYQKFYFVPSNSQPFTGVFSSASLSLAQ
jgi:hypothetical protein